MDRVMRVLETTATVDEERKLVLDEKLPLREKARVRVLIFIPEEEDIPEDEWLQAASKNPVFSFLEEPEEDIYSLADGRPFHDAR